MTVKKITAACEAEARKNNWDVVIAILDDGGHLLWLERMDGATPSNAEIAVEKGRSAAVSRRSTKNWEDRIAAGRNAVLKMPVLPVQGGMPIMVQGECVGGDRRLRRAVARGRADRPGRPRCAGRCGRYCRGGGRLLRRSGSITAGKAPYNRTTEGEPPMLLRSVIQATRP